MDKIAALFASMINFLSSSSGLILQSIFITILVMCAFPLLNVHSQQIDKKDLSRAQRTFLLIILLNLGLIGVRLNHLFPIIALPENFYNAYPQLVWCCNLVLIGWLWIKPARQIQFSVFKLILLCTAIVFCLLETFQPIEMLVAPMKIEIPYTLMWRIFEFITALFLFFLFLFNTGKAQAAAILFAILQILGLGADKILNVTPLFAQTFSQLLAFFFTSMIFEALLFDFSNSEKDIQFPPPILSENQNALPTLSLTESWLQTALESESSVVPFALCKALAATVCADSCLIIQQETTRPEMKVICGYSLTRQKRILPQALTLTEEIITQKKSVLFHQEETFPVWIKVLMRSVHQIDAESAWYVPLDGFAEKYLLVFLSKKDQWSEPHRKYFKKIMPDLVQFLHKYFSEEHYQLPEKGPSKTSQNPFLDLMRTEINQTKDIHQVEAELQLALEEYNRIRKILEERGIG
jgi:hypothetical protein